MADGIPIVSKRALPNAVAVHAPMTADQIRHGLKRLNARLADLHAFQPNQVQDAFNDPHVAKLTSSITATLGDVFGYNTPEHRNYANAANFTRPFAFLNRDATHGLITMEYQKGKEQSVALIESAILFLEEKLAAASNSLTTVNCDKVLSRRIFVVHGHDEGARETVARYLEKIGFEAIILHEQANQGRTIIEKIEAYSDVGFAVVLLTPDDYGGKVGGPSQSRARQNVILELGYFVGHLGRGHVCALMRGEIEVPTDWSGVVYQAMDAGGGWKAALAKELAVLGHNLDWSKVVQ